MIANLIVPILLELGKAARKEDTGSGKWGNEHYAAFAGKRKYIICNLFSPVLLKLQTRMEQKSMAAPSKKQGRGEVTKVADKMMSFMVGKRFAAFKLDSTMGQENLSPARSAWIAKFGLGCSCRFDKIGVWVSQANLNEYQHPCSVTSLCAGV